MLVMTGLHWRNFQEYHQEIGDTEDFKIIKKILLLMQHKKALTKRLQNKHFANKHQTGWNGNSVMFVFALDMKASLTMFDVMIFNFSLVVNIHNGLILQNRPFFDKRSLTSIWYGRWTLRTRSLPSCRCVIASASLKLLENTLNTLNTFLSS